GARRRDDRGEHLEVREPDGVASAPPLQEQVTGETRRHDEERQQEQRPDEAHGYFSTPRVQIATTCSSTRLPTRAGRLALARIRPSRTVPARRTPASSAAVGAASP